MDIRPAHKVTRLGSPKKRGQSGSPSRKYWTHKVVAQNLTKQLETQIQIDMKL
jgi:hypothetical protein